MNLIFGSLLKKKTEIYIIVNEDWINADHITSLDYYRKSIKYVQELVDLACNLVEKNKLELVYERIAKSNQIEMFENISSVMC